jgi:hypothetical protein
VRLRCRMSARIKDALFRLLGSERPPVRGIPVLLDVAEPGLEDVGFKGAHRLRVSSLYRRLLAEFVLPNSANAVARSTYWKEAFHEPVRVVLDRLKAHGLLVEPDNPRARMCRNRDESDLRVLCLEHGLLPLGRADELTDRLLTIDPSGWLLGYAGELLQCSEFAARTIVAHSKPLASAPLPDPDLGRGLTHGDIDGQQQPAQSRIEPGPSDNEVIWQMLKDQANQTARDGNLSLCRNVHLAMANHLLRRNKQAKALQALCVVCVFDLCGVRNRGDAPAEIRKTYSGFDATRASLDPWLVKRVSSLCREMPLSIGQIREAFLGVTTRLQVPRDARKLWAVLKLALEGSLDSDDEVRRSRLIQKLLE